MKFVNGLLVMLTLCAHAAPERADANSLATAQLREQLNDARYARIGIDGRTLVLTKPQFVAEGLEYRKVENYEHHRPSIAGEISSPVPPPHPVPWSRIERLELGHTTRLPSAAFGGFVGAVAGGATALAWANYGDLDRDEVPAAAMMTGLVFGAIGAGIGALIPATRWQAVDRSAYAATTLPSDPTTASLERIEATYRTRTPGALIGGAVGLGLGIALANANLEAMGEQGDVPASTSNQILGVAACAAIGAGIGALFPVTRTRQVSAKP